MTLLLEHHDKGATHRVYDEPERCPTCQSMHFFWTNRNGLTQCSGCDERVKS